MFEQPVTMGPGTATYTQHTFEILVMLLGAFLLGLWLGWLLWSKYKQQVEALELENQSLKGTVSTVATDLALVKVANQQLQISEQQLKEENAELEAAVDTANQQLEHVSGTLEQTKAEVHKLENELVNSNASTPESANVPLEVVHSDVDLHIEDLTAETVSTPDPLVEGVVLATAEPEVIQPVVVNEPIAPDLLAEGGEIEEELEVIEPNPPVIRMALTPENLAEGAVILPRSDLKIDTDVAVTKVVEPHADVVVQVQDNLKIIEGIGPKIEQILFNHNIKTYSQLAATPVSRIKEMLINEGSHFATHDPSTWPSQALLAANGEWENLKSYQTYLHGGRKPD